MPVRYDIASMVPQISGGGAIDPLNYMAQMRQQEMAEAQMNQMNLRGYYQDLAAQRAAEASQRAAETSQRQTRESEVRTQAEEEKILADKIHRTFSAIPAGDQKSFVAAAKRFSKYDPEFSDWLSQQEYNEDLRNRLTLSAEKQADIKKPEYAEFGGEVYKKTPQGLMPAPIISAEGMPSARQDLATNLIKEREGFIPTPKFDVNADRVGYGSDTVTREDGTVEKVRKGMAPITEQDAERDLQRRIQTEFVPKAAAKVGEENWSRLPENTRAALTSVAYNYGNIPTRIVPAVQSGNPDEIARAIESLAGDNKGVNAGRRMQEANIARGTGMPGSQAVPAFAAAGAPTFMGGPQIQPPINMMGAAPVNAMSAPQQPVPQAAPISAPQPVTVGTKKQVVGQSNVEKTLGRMNALYATLDEMNEIPSEKRGTLANIGAYARGTTLGQEVEKARATPAQTKRNEIRSLQRALLNDIKNSTGMSAQEINSNFELKNMLETLSDPTQSIESVKAILADISARYGQGKVAMPAEAAPPAEAPANRPPLSSFFKR
jgi:GH24 family phage-related lysozyme (muramidase)